MHERVCSEGPRTRVYLARKSKASEQHQRAHKMAWHDKVEKEFLRQHKKLKAMDARAKKNFERNMVGSAVVGRDEANDGYAEQPNSEQQSVTLMSKKRKQTRRTLSPPPTLSFQTAVSKFKMLQWWTLTCFSR